jgi:flavorubredoxin
MEISQSIKYVGVNDHKVDLFEGQYAVPNGMAYNSYVIIDEKVAVLDTVDADFGGEWIANVKAALSGRTPDYLVVHHMEPDHSANIALFKGEFPEAVIVSSAKAFAMMKGFFGSDFEGERIVVGEGDSLLLGKHALNFIPAPMVHWPEVIMSYESTEKVLFAADAFGKFGALDIKEEWTDEARRYYIGIVGKYGQQVQAVLKKAAALDIKTICSLHGPVLNENLGYYIGLYDTWSSYRPECEGVLIAYASIYGNTKAAALRLLEMLKAKGVDVKAIDLARCDVSEATAQAFRYSKLVLASSTYNAEVFPPMREFLSNLTERNYQKRTVALIENGSWAPMAAKVMRAAFEKSKDITFTDTVVTIRSAMNADTAAALEAMANELC